MTELTCASGVELLMDYLEGVLARDVVRDLEAHVAGCARCRAYVASYRATPAILREATAASLPPELERSLAELLRRRRQ